MRLTPLLLTTTCLLYGCATTIRTAGDGPHDVLVFTGRIDSITSAAAVMNDLGFFQLGTYGAAGGLAAGIIRGLPKQEEHSVYSVMTTSGTIKPAPTGDKFSVGDCVDALVSKNKANNAFWKLGEITLRLSTSCNDAYVGK